MITLLCGATQMFADLIVVDDPEYGPSSIVRDTGTGLDWLNLHNTADLSYNTVSSNFGQGGMFQGFRYASLDDVGTLFVDANIPNIDDGITSANFQPVANLLNEIGALHVGDPCFCDASFAINGQSLSPGTHEVSELVAYFLPPPGEGEAIRDSEQANDDFRNLETGSFIIRETPTSIPEPRPFPLLIVASLGVLCRRWYRGAGE